MSISSKAVCSHMHEVCTNVEDFFLLKEREELNRITFFYMKMSVLHVSFVERLIDVQSKQIIP